MTVVIALDVNAFYCAVEERNNPALRDVPFAVIQKQVVATLSYAARRLGLRKLMLLSEATKLVPELVLVNGENLSKYRAEGKFLYNLIKHEIFRDEVPVERLGLEEFRFDVSDIVQYNIRQLRRKGVIQRTERRRRHIHNMGQNEQNKTRQNETEKEQELMAMGWNLYLTSDGSASTVCQDFFFNLPGNTVPDGYSRAFPVFANSEDPRLLELYVAAHIAHHVCDTILTKRGYTCSAGVAVNKTLAKMAGACHKPAGLTSLVPSATQEFLDPQRVRSIPGFGSKTEKKLAERLDILELDKLTVKYVRTALTAADFDHEFRGQDQGQFLWGLLHGQDDSPIRDSEGLPSQISVEDTYTPALQSPTHVKKELAKLVTSVLAQAKTDLQDPDNDDNHTWKVVPTTVKLTIRDSHQNVNWYDRKSRSARLPSYFASHLKDPAAIVERLIDECIWKLFTMQVKPRYEIRLINVALVNFTGSQSPAPTTAIDKYFR